MKKVLVFLLVLALAVNLGALFLFKYLGFSARIVRRLFGPTPPSRTARTI